MDIGSLAAYVTAALSPLLPYLLQTNELVAEASGKMIGGDTWEWAKSLWSKLGPSVAAKPAALKAAQDLAQAPGNTNLQAALYLQITNLLNENQSLAQELQRYFQQNESRETNVWAVGNQTVGGDANNIPTFTNQVPSSDFEIQSDPAAPMLGDDDDFMRKRK